MFYKLILVLYVFGVNLTKALIVEPEWKIYYDLRTNRTIDSTDTSNPRLHFYRHRSLRIGFGPIPCSCQDFTCGCCTGMNIEAANFNRAACMNFTYIPQEFGINMAMLMNDEALLNQTISAKNPPPICMPAPLPPVLPKVDFCMRFFNIHTDSYNIFTCVDFETRIERAPILVLHFDCMRMGQDGVSLHKPDEDELLEQLGEAGNVPNDEEIEIYDEVEEDSDAAQTNNTVHRDATHLGKSKMR